MTAIAADNRVDAEGLKQADTLVTSTTFPFLVARRMEPEVPPAYGTLVAFKRAEDSFHGHLPFEGERRVIQVAWPLSAEDKLRKAKRGRLSQCIKICLAGLTANEAATTRIRLTARYEALNKCTSVVITPASVF